MFASIKQHGYKNASTSQNIVIHFVVVKIINLDRFITKMTKFNIIYGSGLRAGYIVVFTYHIVPMIMPITLISLPQYKC